jgi:hypothetical protein
MLHCQDKRGEVARSEKRHIQVVLAMEMHPPGGVVIPQRRADADRRELRENDGQENPKELNTDNKRV